MQHLKTALKWAVDQEYLKVVPKFPVQDRKAAKKKHMKGRPITGEEFDRLLDACMVISQAYLLNGLWVSTKVPGGDWASSRGGRGVSIKDDGAGCPPVSSHHV